MGLAFLRECFGFSGEGPSGSLSGSVTPFSGSGAMKGQRGLFYPLSGCRPFLKAPRSTPGPLTNPSSTPGTCDLVQGLGIHGGGGVVSMSWVRAWESRFTSCRLFFFFQLGLTFNIILYCFQAYSMVVRHSCNSGSDPRDKSGTHHAVITLVLIMFSVPDFTSRWPLNPSYRPSDDLPAFTFLSQPSRCTPASRSGGRLGSQ